MCFWKESPGINGLVLCILEHQAWIICYKVKFRVECVEGNKIFTYMTCWTFMLIPLTDLTFEGAHALFSEMQTVGTVKFHLFIFPFYQFDYTH